MIKNELKLIHAAKNGDKTSFSELLKLHQVKLRTYLIARCHSMHDADDVLQETCINAYKYLHTYNEKWQFNTWLFTIANRLIKKQQNFYINHVEMSEVSDFNEPDELRIDVDNIWIQLKKHLSQQAYNVIWLFYVEDLSTKEIAHILQRSNSWVKIILYRSRKKLAANKNLRKLSNDYLMGGMIL
jgi:RNA polymerase sigma-70 factor (ECF subfamily)